jgi:hypothetical protein
MVVVQPESEQNETESITTNLGAADAVRDMADSGKGNISLII